MYESLFDLPLSFTPYLDIILDILGIVIALGTIVAFLRRHRPRVPEPRTTVAWFIGGSYALWASLASLSWGIVTVYAVRQPTFLAPSAFLGHVAASAIFLLVTVLVPGLVARRVMKRLTSEPPKSRWFYRATAAASMSGLAINFLLMLLALRPQIPRSEVS